MWRGATAAVQVTAHVAAAAGGDVSRAPRGDGTHANPRWLVDVDCERMLEVASAVVEASPRMRVLGIEATDTVLKAYVSLLGTAVVFFAALLTSSSSSIYQVASGADAAASSAGGAR